MKKYDRISSLVWVGIGLAVCLESIRLGPGVLSAPGPGLVPLGCGLIIETFGLIIFARTFRNVAEERKALWERGTHWGKLVSIPGALMGYAFLIDLLGFKLVTFLWVGVMCLTLGKMEWKATLLTSAVTMLLSYILFEYYLGVRFPRGFLGF